MKKFIILTIAFMSYLTSFAQLNVTSKSTKVERIGSARMGVIAIEMSITDSDTAVIINTQSTNSIDKRYVYVLGRNPKSAFLTICDLIKLFDEMEKNSAITVKDAFGEDFVVTKNTILGAMCLSFKTTGYVGTFNLGRSEIVKCKDIIKEYFKFSEPETTE